MSKTSRFIRYCFAVIFLVGGIFGIIKGLFPDYNWLSFRYLIGGGAAFSPAEMPLYVRAYGIGMSLLEIIAAICLIIKKKKTLIFTFVVIILNMLGCIVAIFMGDSFSIISLILRFIPLYFTYQLIK